MMQIVIEIPKGIIEYVKNNDSLAVCFADEIAKAIKNGIQLPKWHGRLIDVNDIPIDCDYYDVDNAPTLIEADSGLLEEKRPVDPVYTTGIYDDYDEPESVSITDVDDIQF